VPVLRGVCAVARGASRSARRFRPRRLFFLYANIEPPPRAPDKAVLLLLLLLRLSVSSKTINTQTRLEEHSFLQNLHTHTRTHLEHLECRLQPLPPGRFAMKLG
jgi:hypothetical protein